MTESAAPNLTNYYLTTPTADRTQSLDVTAGGTAEAHFTNTYEPYLSVTITKKVVGDMGDTTKNFSFTATLDTTQIRQGSAYTTAGDGAALTDTGFTLRSGGSVTLTHLRADQTLTLTETDPATTRSAGSSTATTAPPAQPARYKCPGPSPPRSPASIPATWAFPPACTPARRPTWHWSACAGWAGGCCAAGRCDPCRGKTF